MLSGGSTAALDLTCWEIMGAATSEVAAPAAAAAATVAVVGGGYLAAQWAMQDNGPAMPPLYPTLGQNVGDGNISITIPVPSSTTITSGVPLTPGAQTQSTGATVLNQPTQQIVEPLPTQQTGNNFLYASQDKRVISINRGIRNLQSNITEHQQKLADYIRDPYAYDNKNMLANAPSEEVRQRIIQTRIQHLEGEMQEWQKQIEAYQRELETLSK